MLQVSSLPETWVHSKTGQFFQNGRWWSETRALLAVRILSRTCLSRAWKSIVVQKPRHKRCPSIHTAVAAKYQYYELWPCRQHCIYPLVVVARSQVVDKGHHTYYLRHDRSNLKMTFLTRSQTTPYFADWRHICSRYLPHAMQKRTHLRSYLLLAAGNWPIQCNQSCCCG